MSEASDIFCIDEHNFVQVLRGLLPRHLLVGLRNTILDAEARTAGAVLQSQNPRAEIQGVLPDLIRVDKRWYDVWRDVDLTRLLKSSSGFDQMIFPPQIRHMRKAPHMVPWHQDIAYQKSLGTRGHKQLMTCFVPLDDNPREHPTLEFALSPNQVPVDHVDSGIFHNVMPEDNFAEMRIFDLDLGDVLLFGDLIPHRTFIRPDYPPTRLSMEYRLTKHEYLVPGKDYFDLTKQAFYCAKEREHGQAV